MNKMKKTFIICASVFATALFVSKSLYQFTLIQGDSMHPTYHNMQFAIIDKHTQTFQNGDVIVFYCPALSCTMVKRIIASPGETVLITDGSVLVNGVKSPYVSETISFAGIASKELLLGNDQFFVMGDNYAQSRDSRYEEIGCINRENMIGRLIPQKSPQYPPESACHESGSFAFPRITYF